MGADEGWMSVGDDHDTAAFAVQAIRRWWQVMGAERYPAAKRLMITADAGGSNSYRNRAWKVELHRLAAETARTPSELRPDPLTRAQIRGQLTCISPQIEHRLFSFITKNWRGRPLTSYRTIVELVSATKTKTGLKVLAEWDQGSYPTGVTITDAELEAVPREPHKWHGEWNYTILAKPRRGRRRSVN